MDKNSLTSDPLPTPRGQPKATGSSGDLATESSNELEALERRQKLKEKERTHFSARIFATVILGALCLVLLVSAVIVFVRDRSAAENVFGQVLQVLAPALFTILGYLFGKHYNEKT